MPVDSPRRVRVIIIIIIILHRLQAAIENNVDGSVWRAAQLRVAQVQLLMDENTEAAWTTEKALMDVNTAFEALADYLESTDNPNEETVEGLSDDLAAVL